CSHKCESHRKVSVIGIGQSLQLVHLLPLSLKSVTKPQTLHSLYLSLSPDPAFTISGLPGPCIHYIWSPRTPHSLYLVSPNPAFTISGLPGPRIHYIWSPPDPAFTISGLPGPCIHYIRSPPDPAFTISGLSGPCIHYIWFPRTLHSLYPVSPTPAFTISGLPGPCIHYIRSP
ncbi:unnamed protein product, partial [Staurois parvus]